MVNFKVFYDRLCDWCGEEFNLLDAKEAGDINAEQGTLYCCDECRKNAAFANEQYNNKQILDKKRIERFYKTKKQTRHRATNQDKRQKRLNKRLDCKNPNKI